MDRYVPGGTTLPERIPAMATPPHAGCGRSGGIRTNTFIRGTFLENVSPGNAP
jgi:hypothetical protein